MALTALQDALDFSGWSPKAWESCDDPVRLSDALLDNRWPRLLLERLLVTWASVDGKAVVQECSRLACKLSDHHFFGERPKLLSELHPHIQGLVVAGVPPLLVQAFRRVVQVLEVPCAIVSRNRDEWEHPIRKFAFELGREYGAALVAKTLRRELSSVTGWEDTMDAVIKHESSQGRERAVLLAAMDTFVQLRESKQVSYELREAITELSERVAFGHSLAPQPRTLNFHAQSAFGKALLAVWKALVENVPPSDDFSDVLADCLRVTTSEEFFSRVLRHRIYAESDPDRVSHAEWLRGLSRYLPLARPPTVRLFARSLLSMFLRYVERHPSYSPSFPLALVRNFELLPKNYQLEHSGTPSLKLLQSLLTVATSSDDQASSPMLNSGGVLVQVLSLWKKSEQDDPEEVFQAHLTDTLVRDVHHEEFEPLDLSSFKTSACWDACTNVAGMVDLIDELVADDKLPLPTTALKSALIQCLYLEYLWRPESCPVKAAALRIREWIIDSYQSSGKHLSLPPYADIYVCLQHKHFGAVARVALTLLDDSYYASTVQQLARLPNAPHSTLSSLFRAIVSWPAIERALGFPENTVEPRPWAEAHAYYTNLARDRMRTSVASALVQLALVRSRQGVLPPPLITAVQVIAGASSNPSFDYALPLDNFVQTLEAIAKIPESAATPGNVSLVLHALYKEDKQHLDTQLGCALLEVFRQRRDRMWSSQSFVNVDKPTLKQWSECTDPVLLTRWAAGFFPQHFLDRVLVHWLFRAVYVSTAADSHVLVASRVNALRNWLYHRFVRPLPGEHDTIPFELIDSLLGTPEGSRVAEVAITCLTGGGYARCVQALILAGYTPSLFLDGFRDEISWEMAQAVLEASPTPSASEEGDPESRDLRAALKHQDEAPASVDVEFDRAFIRTLRRAVTDPVNAALATAMKGPSGTQFLILYGPVPAHQKEWEECTSAPRLLGWSCLVKPELSNESSSWPLDEAERCAIIRKLMPWANLELGLREKGLYPPPEVKRAIGEQLGGLIADMHTQTDSAELDDAVYVRKKVVAALAVPAEVLQSQKVAAPCETPVEVARAVEYTKAEHDLQHLLDRVRASTLSPLDAYRRVLHWITQQDATLLLAALRCNSPLNANVPPPQTEVRLTDNARKILADFRDACTVADTSPSRDKLALAIEDAIRTHAKAFAGVDCLYHTTRDLEHRAESAETVSQLVAALFKRGIEKGYNGLLEDVRQGDPTLLSLARACCFFPAMKFLNGAVQDAVRPVGHDLLKREGFADSTSVPCLAEVLHESLQAHSVSLAPTYFEAWAQLKEYMLRLGYAGTLKALRGDDLKLVQHLLACVYIEDSQNRLVFPGEIQQSLHLFEKDYADGNIKVPFAEALLARVQSFCGQYQTQGRTIWQARVAAYEDVLARLKPTVGDQFSPEVRTFFQYLMAIAAGQSDPCSVALRAFDTWSPGMMTALLSCVMVNDEHSCLELMSGVETALNLFAAEHASKEGMDRALRAQALGAARAIVELSSTIEPNLNAALERAKRLLVEHSHVANYTQDLVILLRRKHLQLGGHLPLREAIAKGDQEILAVAQKCCAKNGFHPATIEALRSLEKEFLGDSTYDGAYLHDQIYQLVAVPVALMPTEEELVRGVRAVIKLDGHEELFRLIRTHSPKLMRVAFDCLEPGVPYPSFSLSLMRALSVIDTELPDAAAPVGLALVDAIQTLLTKHAKSGGTFAHKYTAAIVELDALIAADAVPDEDDPALEARITLIEAIRECVLADGYRGLFDRVNGQDLALIRPALHCVEERNGDLAWDKDTLVDLEDFHRAHRHLLCAKDAPFLGHDGALDRNLLMTVRWYVINNSAVEDGMAASLISARKAASEGVRGDRQVAVKLQRLFDLVRAECKQWGFYGLIGAMCSRRRFGGVELVQSGLLVRGAEKLEWHPDDRRRVDALEEELWAQSAIPKSEKPDCLADVWLLSAERASSAPRARIINTRVVPTVPPPSPEEMYKHPSIVVPEGFGAQDAFTQLLHTGSALELRLVADRLRASAGPKRDACLESLALRLRWLRLGDDIEHLRKARDSQDPDKRAVIDRQLKLLEESRAAFFSSRKEALRDALQDAELASHAPPRERSPEERGVGRAVISTVAAELAPLTLAIFVADMPAALRDVVKSVASSRIVTGVLTWTVGKVIPEVGVPAAWLQHAKVLSEALRAEGVAEAVRPLVQALVPTVQRYVEHIIEKSPELSAPTPVPLADVVPSVHADRE